MKKWILLLFFLWIPFCLIFIQNNTRGYQEQIVKVTSSKTIEKDRQELTVTGLNQELAKKERKLTHTYTASLADSEAYQKGDILFVKEKQQTWEVTGVKRDGYFFLIAGFLIAVVLLVGGLRGARALFSILVNLVVLYVFLAVYTSVNGISVLLVMGLFLVSATILTLFILDGWNKTSFLKITGTLLSTLLAFLICWGVMQVTGDKGLRFEEMQFLTRPYRAIFLASLMVGTLGAAMDTVITVISTMEELEKEHPNISKKELAHSGRIVGRDVMGSMTNVLLFAYLSGSIPAIALYLQNGWRFVETIEMNLSLELLRALCGSLGIILTIPISIALYSWRDRR